MEYDVNRYALNATPPPQFAWNIANERERVKTATLPVLYAVLRRLSGAAERIYKTG
jgi:hypothetical protein